MNIHDARAVYTRQTIEKEFLKLLKTKPVSKITVSELCTVCHINRATFYKHYTDIYGLMDSMEQIMTDQIDLMIRPEQCLDVKGLLTDLLRSTLQFGDTWLVMFSPNGDPSLAARILHLCYEKGLPLMQKSVQSISPAEQKRLYTFLSHGSAGVMLDWITSGMKEPPEEVAAFLEQTYHTLLNTH